MSDERATFEQTKARLEEILVQVRKKDTSLEQSLDLLEEGVRLANACNELIDQTSWRSAAEGDAEEDTATADTPTETADDTPAETADDTPTETADDTSAEQLAEPLLDDERS